MLSGRKGDSSSSLAIAHFLEAHGKELLARLHIEAALKDIISHDLLDHWLDNEIEFHKGAARPAFQWIALWFDFLLNKQAKVEDAFTALSLMRNTLIDFCLGRIPELPDTAIYASVLLGEDHLLKHARDLYAELKQKTVVAQQRRVKTIVNAIQHPFVIMDSNGAIEYANDLLCRIIGFPAEQLLGQCFLSFCRKETAVEIRRDLRQKRGTASPCYRGAILLPGDKTLDANLYVAPFFDPDGLRNGLAVSVICREDTGRDIHSGHVRLFEALASALGIGFYLIDFSLRVTFANAAAGAGVRPGIEDPKPDCCRQHMDKKGTCADCLRKRPFKTGEPYRATVRFEDAGGGVQWVEMACIPLRNEQGEVAHLAKFVRNVTEQKLLENQLLQQQRTGLMTQLAVSVAHQLRNPLGVMIGFAELLSRGMPPEQVPMAVDKILRNGMRCKEVVENLFEFGRAFQEAPRPTDLRQLLRERIQPLYAGAADRLEWNLNAELPTVLCAAEQLVLVLMRLLDYAQGVATKQVKIDTRLKPNAGEIAIWNDGAPLTAEQREHLFDPAYGTGRTEHGAGLTLSLSRQLIEEVGGRLYIDEAVAQGTCFVVELPASGEAAPILEQPVHAGPPLPERRVLIVEDDADQLFMLSLALHGQGWVIDTASAGADGVEMLNRNKYDALVIDILLGDGLGGIEIYQILSGAHPDLLNKTLFITGDTMKYETRRFLTETKRPYLEKPFMMTEFSEEVRKLIETV